MYKDGFYCFACGAGGDVINFVARMEQLPNHAAAARAAEIGGLKLDDGYRARARAQKRAQERRRREQDEEAKRERLNAVGREYRRLRDTASNAIPYSDDWCAAVRALPAAEAELERLLYELSGDAFAKAAKLEEMAEAAKEAGFRNFKKLYRSFEDRMRGGGGERCNVSEFEGQPLELDTGIWRADDLGVTCAKT